jgi:hypothetical protein
MLGATGLVPVVLLVRFIFHPAAKTFPANKLQMPQIFSANESEASLTTMNEATVRFINCLLGDGVSLNIRESCIVHVLAS